MLKRLFVGVVLMAAVGCGGGGGSDGNTNGNTEGQPQTEQSVTLETTTGATTIVAGKTATVHAAVGDTLAFQGTEVFDFTQHGVTGHTCSLNYVGGIQSSMDKLTVKIRETTDQCVLQFTFSSGTAEFVVLVP